MKQIFTFLFLLLPPLLTAGGAPPAIVGSWDGVAVDERGTQSAWTLYVKSDGGKLSASVQSNRDGYVIEALEPALEGSHFTFKIRINPSEVVEVSLKVEGNRLDGQFRGKDSGTGSFKATRRSD